MRCSSGVVRRTCAVSWTVASNTLVGARATAAASLHCYTRRPMTITRAASGALPALGRGLVPSANAGAPVAITK
ncbi:unnamed protein product [Colias eurytheme]|nr:unnamed protein product [Colias eurytheme]